MAHTDIIDFALLISTSRRWKDKTRNGRCNSKRNLKWSKVQVCFQMNRLERDRDFLERNRCFFLNGNVERDESIKQESMNYTWEALQALLFRLLMRPRLKLPLLYLISKSQKSREPGSSNLRGFVTMQKVTMVFVNFRDSTMVCQSNPYKRKSGRCGRDQWPGLVWRTCEPKEFIRIMMICAFTWLQWFLCVTIECTWTYTSHELSVCGYF